MAVEPFGIERDHDGPYAGCAVLRLDQPGAAVVVLDQPLLQRLDATLRAMPRDLLGLVVASANPRVFVAGADLKSIAEWPDDQLAKYLKFGAGVFGALSQLPFPTAAAINGAALGGGLELAMHCDGLIAAPPPMKDGQPGKPYAVGLPECGLGLCPGWGGTNLLPARIDAEEAIRRTASGATFTFVEAAGLGLFDRVAPAAAGELLATAKAWVMERARAGRVERDGAPSRWIGRPAVAARVMRAVDAVRGELPAAEPAAAVADAVNVGLTAGWGHALAAEQRHLVRLRGMPAARGALQAFFARSAKK